MNPYRQLPDHHFWRRAMLGTAPGLVDPVLQAPRIEPQHLVASMGSCFAQHLTRHLAAQGLGCFVAETPPEGMAAERADTLGYGVYSARYGNVYTARQAVQLFDRAFGTFTAREEVWERDGRYVDAFRPAIDPEGFETPQAVRAAAAAHLAHVRDVFSRPHWLVFTLGQTEAWRSRADGAVYPVAPGVAGGAFDPARHEFVNFTATEVAADLDALVARIASVNPKARLLLTVSPVAMAATAEPRHVSVANTVTKARLRVAADDAERRHERVVYFPSYEIITSPAAGGRYLHDDLREVNELGIKHVMRVFMRHFVEGNAHRPDLAAADLARAEAYSSVTCDDDLIERSLTALRAGSGQTPD